MACCKDYYENDNYCNLLHCYRQYAKERGVLKTVNLFVFLAVVHPSNVGQLPPLFVIRTKGQLPGIMAINNLKKLIANYYCYFNSLLHVKNKF